MEIVIKLSWAALALVHAAPTAALFSAQALRALYGLEPRGDHGLLMRHRGALFLALVVLACWASWDPQLRRPASLVIALSVLSFLSLYLHAGSPSGSPRTIAIVDALALIPLGAVLYDAWWRRS